MTEREIPGWVWTSGTQVVSITWAGGGAVAYVVAWTPYSNLGNSGTGGSGTRNEGTSTSLNWLAEVVFSAFRAVMGGTLMARRFLSQKAEVTLKVLLYNRFMSF